MIGIQKQYQQMKKIVNEKQWRQYLALETKRKGNIGVVSQDAGVSRNTIKKGIREIESGDIYEVGARIRKEGGGKKKLEHHNPHLVNAVDDEAGANADKRVVVKHTSKSFAKIAEALVKRGIQIGRTAVGRILKDLGYALQANIKDEGGKNHPDRDGQFKHINMKCLHMQLQGYPIYSADCKKTEKLGNYKNGGKEWVKRGEEMHVKDHDFGEKDPKTKQIKKAIPYGILNINPNQINQKRGYVRVGITTNTAEFAVAAIERNWEKHGKQDYPEAREILLLVDSGSSNGYKNNLFKYELQQFANRAKKTIHVSHYPPGTSKWNAIEHEMFCFININWRATPLISYEVIIERLKNTTNKKGLTIDAELDERVYEKGKGKALSKEQMANLNITGATFHPEWNYTIRPQ